MEKITDELLRFCYGTDASFYRKTPQQVIRADNEAEVAAVLRECSAKKTPVTFRAAGTSLSGQSVSDSVLLVAAKGWERYCVGDGGETVTLQPGIVGAKVNRILKPYGRKFGPDPASIGSCMVGGIMANNASGMSCGIHANADKTLLSARIVFADGTLLDTGDPASREAFRRSHPAFLDSLEALRDEVRADRALADRIRHKYSIKNVTGLNLLPLITQDDPFDMIAHLLVGSEGTLAFISEATFRTVPLAPLQASAMIYFQDISDAARAVLRLQDQPVEAAEMLDKCSLAAAGDTTGEGLTALLVRTEASDEETLSRQIRSIGEALKDFDTVTGIRFSRDKEECARYWAIRSGIFPMVGGMRPEGTTCLIEDIAFHIEDLPAATAGLCALLERHGYADSCIYGHALAGNFHFIINQSFDSEAEIRRYEAMIRDVAEMVVGKYDGSLKAEHGTGRNMAPFVAYEWGERAFGVMRRIKRIFDPEGILNPGVIFNDDPLCFIKDIKALPVLKPAPGAPEGTLEAFRRLNKCIECGFCEVNCVSCGFTLSSRQRIAVLREMARLEADGSDPGRLRLLKKRYTWPGEQTCAGDGLCSMSCPMKINVADLTHEIRRQHVSDGALWRWAALHYHGTKSMLRGALGLAWTGRRLLGDKLMTGLGRGLHSLGFPLWTPSMPRPYNARKVVSDLRGDKPKVVYFPSCLNQMMGPSKASLPRRPLVEETVELLHKAGYEVIFPEGKDSLCCGTVWESKGMPAEADAKLRELEDALWKASEGGEYPVLCDQSPCLHRMRANIAKMHLYEPAEFIWKFLRERLRFTQTDTPVMVHQTCTMRLMGLGDTLVNLARLCSSKVSVPEDVGCCAFAGDKGMTHPELNAWALRHLRQAVVEAGAETGYSNSRTCEIGLETHGGIPYVSIVYLVNACTAPIC